MDPTPPARFELFLAALHECDVHALDDAALRDVLVAAEHVRNASEALQARLMVEMRDRTHAADLCDAAHRDFSVVVPTGAREEFVIDEIALHLRCTRVAASHRFAVALAAHQHHPLGTAWAAGRIEARKVGIIGDLLLEVEPVLATPLAASAVDYATSHTGPQLRAWLGRRVLAADPAAAEQRRHRATAGRRVSLIPLPDGVAELSALMPALQARHVFDTLTAIAHAAVTGDARALDQRRSDALYDVVTGRAEPPAVHLNVTVPASTLIGAGDRPGQLAGHGPLTAEAVRELLAGALRRSEADGRSSRRDGPAGAENPTTASDPTGLTSLGEVQWRRLLTDPATGVLTDIAEQRYRPSARLDGAVRARDWTCRFPGCRRPAVSARSGVDLDHTTPWPAGSTSADNLACLCRPHHRLKHSPGWRVTLDPDGNNLSWTTPTGHRFATTPWQYDDPPDALDEAA